MLTAGPLAELVLGNWKPLVACESAELVVGNWKPLVAGPLPGNLKLLAAGTLVAALVLGNWNGCRAGVLAEVLGN